MKHRKWLIPNMPIANLLHRIFGIPIIIIDFEMKPIKARMFIDYNGQAIGRFKLYNEKRECELSPNGSIRSRYLFRWHLASSKSNENS